jgi:hypothetical protein
MIALGATPPVLLWALAHPPLDMYTLVTLRLRVHAKLVGACDLICHVQPMSDRIFSRPRSITTHLHAGLT